MSESEVTNQYGRLVHKYAWRYASRLPRRSMLTREDLVQEGFAVLLRVAKTYRATVGAPFLNYACLCLGRRLARLVREEHEHAARLVAGESALLHACSTGPSQPLVDLRVDLDRRSYLRQSWPVQPRSGVRATELRERLAAVV